MIIKIQRSLNTAEDAGSVLIYNKQRTVLMEKPLTSRYQHLLGQNLKGYFKASIDSNGHLHIQKPVADQEW